MVCMAKKMLYLLSFESESNMKMNIIQQITLCLVYLIISKITANCIRDDGNFQYETIFDLLQNEDNSFLIQFAFEFCAFGTNHPHLNRDHCQKHCLLRSNCLSVAMSRVKGCQMCFYGEGTEDFNLLNTNKTYADLAKLQQWLEQGKYVNSNIYFIILSKQNYYFLGKMENFI